MVETPSRTEVGYAAVAGAAGVAGSYAVAGYSRQFVVAPIDALVVRLTPGPIVAWVIGNVGDPGHLLHIALSFAIAVGLLGASALAGLVLARRLGRPLVGVGVAGLLGWLAAAVVTWEPLLAVGSALPIAAAVAVGVAAASRPGHDPSRRRAITLGAGALGYFAVALGVGTFATSRGRPDTGGPLPGTDGSDNGSGSDGEPGEGEEESGPVAELRTLAADRELDIASEEVPGLVSEIGEFYNVDIAQFDPELAADDWSLTLTGQVGESVEITFDELASMPVEHRFVTLRCVGETLNGHKLDNAIWTGTPIKPLLDRADPEGECGCAMLHAEDDYFVQFPVEALEDGFLAWGMNGQALPTSHGHPVRVLVPGHWGETNVKWLSEIEMLDEEADGYWEQRGWQGTGPVNTVAKLWGVTELEDGRIELAGHAYAGTRGIDLVQVSTDSGTTWNEAELSEPLPGDDVWRQWRYVFTPSGTHGVTVRAVDGEGTLQESIPMDSFPSGATGWVHRSVDG